MALSAIHIAPNNYKNRIASDRVLLMALSKGVPGVIMENWQTGLVNDDLKVVMGSEEHEAYILPGRALVGEKENPESRGMYFVHMDDDDDTAQPLPQPKSQPFIATFVLRVVDPQYGGATGDIGPRIDIIEGTPASAPTPVSDATINAVSGTPGGWERLADVRINPADTGAVPAAQVDDRRRSGGFGRIACRSDNKPTVRLKRGQEIYETNTGRIYMWNGASWELMGGRVPAVALTKTSPTQAVAAANTWTAVSFNTDLIVQGSGDMHSTGQPERITFPVQGIYDVHFQFTIEPANTGGALYARLVHKASNGTVKNVYRGTSLIRSTGGIDTVSARALIAEADNGDYVVGEIFSTQAGIFGRGPSTEWLTRISAHFVRGWA